jgi:hypothetical protein
MNSTDEQHKKAAGHPVQGSGWDPCWDPIHARMAVRNDSIPKPKSRSQKSLRGGRCQAWVHIAPAG